MHRYILLVCTSYVAQNYSYSGLIDSEIQTPPPAQYSPTYNDVALPIEPELGSKKFNPELKLRSCNLLHITPRIDSRDTSLGMQVKVGSALLSELAGEKIHPVENAGTNICHR